MKLTPALGAGHQYPTLPSRRLMDLRWQFMNWLVSGPVSAHWLDLHAWIWHDGTPRPRGGAGVSRG